MDHAAADTTDLTITGMTCEGCTAAVSRALGKVAGVTAVTVDLATGRARIEGHAVKRDLEHAVEAAGYDLAAPHG
jgi:Au+-exporting ATPase